jgi:hypothetical protein
MLHVFQGRPIRAVFFVCLVKPITPQSLDSHGTVLAANSHIDTGSLQSSAARTAARAIGPGN